MSNHYSGGYQQQGPNGDAYGWQDPAGQSPFGPPPVSGAGAGPGQPGGYDPAAQGYGDPHQQPPQPGYQPTSPAGPPPGYQPTSPAGPYPQSAMPAPGMPPQQPPPMPPGAPGYGGPGAPPPKKSSAPLIVSLVVGVALLAGIAITAILLLGGDDDPEDERGSSSDGQSDEDTQEPEELATPPDEVAAAYYEGIEANDVDAMTAVSCSSLQTTLNSLDETNLSTLWELAAISEYEVIDSQVVTEESAAEAVVEHRVEGVSADIVVHLVWESEEWRVCDFDEPTQEDYS